MKIVLARKASPSRLALPAVVASMIVGGVACYPKSGAAPSSISPGSVAYASKKWPGATEQTLEAGKQTFLAKCNGCHDYPDLSAIPDEDWPGIVERMGGKSDLDEAKTKGVLQFILASRHP